VTRLALIGLVALLSLPAAAQEVSEATGATLRGLDKVNGAVRDLDLAIGASVKFGALTVKLSDCRFPVGNPAGDAYAHLTITEAGADTPDFDGWMIASAPALNALDHPRYDIWLLRCKIE